MKKKDEEGAGSSICMDLDCSDGVNSSSFCIISKRYRYRLCKGRPLTRR